ncbi:MAG: 4Fe-4S binding protein [Clostridia bacterium]|nr:4Fe-4S binding protein [Clostridia bacterium]
MANYIPQIRYDDCYGCKACLYNCPVSLFTLSHKVTRRGMRRELPEPTRIEDCIGCGVCARACPVEAIDMIKTQPAEGKDPIYIDWDAPVRIDPNKCKGCTACARICPGNAIEGTVKNPHVVVEDKCLKCGLCIEKCKFSAIYNSNDPVPELVAAPAAEAAEAAAPAGGESYRIDPEKCKGCTACAKVCPAEAIKGELKVAHEIDQDKCLKCGACFEKCKLGAIIKE